MLNLFFVLGHFLKCPIFYSQQNISQLFFAFFIGIVAVIRFPEKYLVIGLTAFGAAFVSLLQCVMLRADIGSFLTNFPYLFPHNVTSVYFGIYAQRNLLAAFLLIGFFVLIQWFEDTQQSWLVRFIPLTFMASVILLTNSRAALLGLVFGWFTTVYPQRYNKRSWCISLWFLVIILSGWGLSHLYGGPNSFTEFSDKTFQGSSGVWSRLIYWCAAVLVGLDHFWFGTGFGGMKEVYGNYLLQAAQMLHLPTDMYKQTIWPHNDFLHIFAEFGFPVFVIFCSFCFYVVWVAYRKKFYAISGAFVAFYIMMFFSHPFRLPMLVVTFVLLSVYVLKEELRRFWGNVWLRRGYVLLVCAFGVWLIPQASSMLQLNQLMTAYRQGEIKSADSFEHWAKQAHLDRLNSNKVGGWRFQHSYYAHVVHDIFFENFDREYAEAVLPYALRYSQKNAFYTMDYVMARLYYVLGDYKEAMQYSWSAFDKKPDKSKYYSFYHLCHVLYKCRQTNTPFIKALDAERVDELLDNGLIHLSQFDENWHVL
ncbi:MAG: O-antigen ligase family protein [Desulfuromonas sp.]|nr:O-antigen ligase family protein [Desulfuromonas sp.]